MTQASESPSERSLQPPAETARQEKEKSFFERLPKNSKEFIDRAMDAAVSRLVAKLDSKDGIGTDGESYRKEIAAILLEAETALAANHPLKGIAKPFVENFLEPPVKGAAYVESLLEWRMKSQKEKSAGITEKEVSTGLEAAKSAVSFAFDIAVKNPERIPGYFNEIRKAFPQAEGLFSKYPDIASVITDVVPGIAKNTDKAVFMARFDRFLRSVAPEISKNLREKKSDPEGMMKVANEFAKFFRDSITEKNVKAGMKGISSLPSIQNDKIASRLIALVNHPSVTDVDRYRMVRSVNDLAVTLTTRPPAESDIRKNIDSVMSTATEIAAKIPGGKRIVAEIAAEILGPLLKGKGDSKTPESGADKIRLDSDSAKEVARFLYSELKDLGSKSSRINELLTGNFDTVMKLADFLEKSRILDDLVGYAKGQLMEKLGKVLDLKFTDLSKSIMARLSETKKGADAEKSEGIKESPVKPIGNDFTSRFTANLLAETESLMIGKNRPKSVTKEMLVESVLSVGLKTVESFPGDEIPLSKNPDFKMKKSFLIEVFKNPEIRELAMSVAREALSAGKSETSKAKGSMERLANKIAEFKNAPFSHPQFWEKAKNLAIDAFFRLPAPELVKFAKEAMAQSGIRIVGKDGGEGLSEKDLVEIVNAVRESETLSRPLIEKTLTPPVEPKKIALEIAKAVLEAEEGGILIEKLSKKPEGGESLLQKILSARIEKNREGSDGSRTESGEPPKDGEGKTAGSKPEKAPDFDKSKIPELLDLVFLAEKKTSPEIRSDVFAHFGIDSKKAEFGLSMLKELGKENASSLLTNHFDLIKSVMNREIDPKSNPEAFVAPAADLLYNIEPSKITTIAERTKELFPQLKGFLETRHPGGTALEYLVRIRENVPKGTLVNFLTAHARGLAELGSNFQLEKAIRIGADFAGSVDDETLKKLFPKTSFEGPLALVADKIPQIKKAVEEAKGAMVTGPDGKTESRFDAVVRLSVLAKEGKISKEDNAFLAGETFEMLSKILPTFGDWKIPKGDGEKSDALSELKWAFIKENFGFAISAGLGMLFMGKSMETKMTEYFSDPANKPNFVATANRIIEKKSAS